MIRRDVRKRAESEKTAGKSRIRDGMGMERLLGEVHNKRSAESQRDPGPGGPGFGRQQRDIDNDLESSPALQVMNRLWGHSLQSQLNSAALRLGHLMPPEFTTSRISLQHRPGSMMAVAQISKSRGTSSPVPSQYHFSQSQHSMS
jgi:hypothetical protein